MILLLDTAGVRCSVGLLPISQADQTEQNAPIEWFEGVHQHSEKLLQMIEGLLLNSNISWDLIEAIGFNQGPGAFTGLRVAAGVAQGLAFAQKKPILPVSMHEAIAYDYFRKNPDAEVLVVITNAQMQELFVSCYYRAVEYSKLETIQSVCLVHQSDFLLWWQLQIEGKYAAKACHLSLQTIDTFSDFQKVEVAQVEQWNVFCLERMFPLVRKLYDASSFVTPELALPLYVRDKVAFTTQERNMGLASGGNPRAITPNIAN